MGWAAAVRVLAIPAAAPATSLSIISRRVNPLTTPSGVFIAGNSHLPRPENGPYHLRKVVSARSWLRFPTRGHWLHQWFQPDLGRSNQGEASLQICNTIEYRQSNLLLHPAKRISEETSN